MTYRFQILNYLINFSKKITLYIDKEHPASPSLKAALNALYEARDTLQGTNKIEDKIKLWHNYNV